MNIMTMQIKNDIQVKYFMYTIFYTNLRNALSMKQSIIYDEQNDFYLQIIYKLYNAYLSHVTWFINVMSTSRLWLTISPDRLVVIAFCILVKFNVL